METKTEKAPAGQTAEAQNTLASTTDCQINIKVPRVKPGTKEHVILSVLANGRSLNRFEAIHLNDTALNSTIATLQGKGLQIHRERETVPCVNGSKSVDVCR